MVEPSDEAQRRTLEDASALLEATRVQLRALVPALKAWGWEGRLRAVADIARAVARSDAAVARVLERAQRRATVEAWRQGKTLSLLDEVAALRAQLLATLEQRLGEPSSATAGLRVLLRGVVGVPRRVSHGEREAAATEALTLDDELVPTLERLGAALEGVFGRPVQRGQFLPFSLEEYDAARALLAAGAPVLDAAWTAVRRIDTSGGLAPELERRARRAPRSKQRSPTRALVHATFWREFADAQLTTVLAERFAPVGVKPREAVAAMRFLLRRERDGAAVLELPGPRGALLMLAHELTASPAGRARLDGGAGHVARLAAAADALEGRDDDWRRLRDGLRALAVRSSGTALPPLYRVGQSVPARPRLPERLSDFFPLGG